MTDQDIEKLALEMFPTNTKREVENVANKIMALEAIRFAKLIRDKYEQKLKDNDN